jgi:hypothetical protein
MSKKTLRKTKGLRLLEETKQRLRLQQEARTIARIEQLDIEACERLGRQLQLEHLELNGEFDCSETECTILLGFLLNMLALPASASMGWSSAY